MLKNLCRAIDGGARSIGLLPCNGDLFDPRRTHLLTAIQINVQLMADVIDALSFERITTGRKYINCQDLNVRQSGSFYERLLEHEIVPEADEVTDKRAVQVHP